MKRQFAYFLTTILIALSFSCFNDDNTSNIEVKEYDEYKLKVLVQPSDALVELIFMENGEFVKHPVKGIFDEKIYHYPKDSKRITVIQSSDSKVKDPYIKIELYKRKKLKRSAEGNKVVTLNI